MTKKWVPTNYVDEITPPARATPSDWIVNGNALAAFDDAEPPRPLDEGEVVSFAWVETLGDVTIIIGEDGSWSSNPAIPDAPEGAAFHIWIPSDVDTMSFDADSFAACMFEIDGPGEYDAATYAWSTTGTPFRFLAGRFVPVEDGDEREG